MDPGRPAAGTRPSRGPRPRFAHGGREPPLRGHGGETVCPERLTLLGVCRTAPQEHQNLSCRLVDVALPAEGGLDSASLTAVVRQCAEGDPGAVTAVRGEELGSGLRTAEPRRSHRGAAPPASRGGVSHHRRARSRRSRDRGLAGAEAQARLVLVGRSSPRCAPRRSCGPSKPSIRGGRGHGGRRRSSRDGKGRRPRRDRRFSGVQGVFHAAGVTQGSSFARLAEVERTVAAEQVRAKVGGLRVLVTSSADALSTSASSPRPC